MTTQVPNGFEHLYLEDSYLLGMIAEGTRLRLRVLFALTGDHPDYAPPRTGEQHCYREGDIQIGGLRVTEWKSLTPQICIDADGTFDFGSIDIFATGAEYQISTEWFDMRFKADTMAAVLDDNGR